MSKKKDFLSRIGLRDGAYKLVQDLDGLQWHGLQDWVFRARALLSMFATLLDDRPPGNKPGLPHQNIIKQRIAELMTDERKEKS